MKFWCVTWRDDICLDSAGAKFFRSNAEAHTWANKLRKTANKKAKLLKITPVTDAVRLTTLEVPRGLSPKEQVFWALKQQLV